MNSAKIKHAFHDKEFSLLKMVPGTLGRIARIHSSQESRLARLSSLGIVPGSSIRLCRRRPAAIVEVGETTLALGKDLAESIYVEIEEKK